MNTAYGKGTKELFGKAPTPNTQYPAGGPASNAELVIVSLTEQPTSEPTTARRPAIAAFAALFAYAAVLTMPQASVNQLQCEFGVNDSTLAILFSLVMIGFLHGAIFGGRLSDRFGKLPIAVLGCLLMSAAMLLFSRAHSFALMKPAAALAGIGGGLAEVVSMALVSDLYSGPARTKMMNWAQAAFCGGAVAQPLMFARLMSLGMNWRTGYLVAAGLCMACALIVASAFADGPLVNGPLVNGPLVDGPRPPRPGPIDEGAIGGGRGA